MQLLRSIIWHQYRFATITNFFILSFFHPSRGNHWCFIQKVVLIFRAPIHYAYSQVSNRQGCGIVGMVGKNIKANTREDWNSRERGWKKLKVLIVEWGWGGLAFELLFFFPFSNHENYSSKNIFVYSKNKKISNN